MFRISSIKLKTVNEAVKRCVSKRRHRRWLLFSLFIFVGFYMWKRESRHKWQQFNECTFNSIKYSYCTRAHTHIPPHFDKSLFVTQTFMLFLFTLWRFKKCIFSLSARLASDLIFILLFWCWFIFLSSATFSGFSSKTIITENISRFANCMPFLFNFRLFSVEVLSVDAFAHGKWWKQKKNQGMTYKN